jgi:glycerate kinase
MNSNIAPDSIKGSISALEHSTTIQMALERAFEDTGELLQDIGESIFRLWTSAKS